MSRKAVWVLVALVIFAIGVIAWLNLSGPELSPVQKSDDTKGLTKNECLDILGRDLKRCYQKFDDDSIECEDDYADCRSHCFFWGYFPSRCMSDCADTRLLCLKLMISNEKACSCGAWNRWAACSGEPLPDRVILACR